VEVEDGDRRTRNGEIFENSLGDLKGLAFLLNSSLTS
jgi:hypothetical protein